MLKNKSTQIAILLIIIGIVTLVYVVLFRAQGPQTAPVGETEKQQETTQQGDQGQPVPGEQGAGALEGSAEAPQEAVAEEGGTPEGAVTGGTAPAP